MISDAVREQLEEQVLSRLRRLGRRVRLYLLIDGLAMVSAAVVASVLVTLLIDRTLKLDRDMRLAQLLSLLVVMLVLVWRRIVGPLRVPLRPDDLALLVERRHTRLQSRLIFAVEFAAGPGRSAARRSQALIEAVVQQATQAAAAIRFEDVLAHKRARQRAAVTLGCVTLLAAFGALAGPTMAIWFERNVLIRNLEWPQRNRLTVEGLVNGKMIAARGDDEQVVAVVESGFEAPRQVFIEYETPSGQSGRQQMPAIRQEAATREFTSTRPAPGERFTHTFERLAETMRCRVVGGDARTDRFTIEVVDRPEVREVALHVTPPAYTRTDPYDLRAGQTVAQVLKGSRVGLRITTNRPIADIHLLRQTGDQPAEAGPVTRLGDQEFTAEDQPPASATYHFRMTDVLGLSNVSERSRPVQISVRLMADTPPTVKMRIKGAGEAILPEAVLPIEVDMSDAYGLSSASLAARPVKEGVAPTTQPIEGFEAGTKTFRRSFDWVPGLHGFSTGDRIALQAEAADFDNVSGPNVGRSQAIGLRLVERAELLADLQRREQEYRLDFERWVRRQEELYGELLSLIASADKIAANERSSRIAHLSRRQRDYAGRVGTTRTQFEQVLAEMRINRLATPAVETRLGAGIVEPLDQLNRVQMPAAADRLSQIAPSMPADAVQSARQAQEHVLAGMRTVLANMLKWEGFQEAVTLLRDIENMQRQINQETEKRILDEVIGTQPAEKRK